jgi:Tol biopolymer transport system component
VVAVRDGQGWDLWTQEIDQANLTRFTFDSVVVRTPAWSPSGDAIVWSKSAAVGSGIYSKTTSGEGSAQAIITADRVLAPVWSADGRFLAYDVISFATNGDVWYRERSSDGQLGEPAPFAQSRFNEGSPTFSPDSHFLAYVSDETGRNEVYVRSFPNGDGKWRVSTNGGTAPRWRRDGQELFYVEGEQLMAVAVTTRPTFTSRTATPLFSNRMLAAFTPEYDVTADGKRFIARNTPPDERPLAVHVVHNWFEEFRSPR